MAHKRTYKYFRDTIEGIFCTLANKKTNSKKIQKLYCSIRKRNEHTFKVENSVVEVRHDDNRLVLRVHYYVTFDNMHNCVDIILGGTSYGIKYLGIKADDKDELFYPLSDEQKLIRIKRDLEELKCLYWIKKNDFLSAQCNDISLDKERQKILGYLDIFITEFIKRKHNVH